MKKAKINSVANRCYELVTIIKTEPLGISEVKLCLKAEIHPETLRRMKPFIEELYPNIKQIINNEGKKVLIFES